MIVSLKIKTTRDYAVLYGCFPQTTGCIIKGSEIGLTDQPNSSRWVSSRLESWDMSVFKVMLRFYASDDSKQGKPQ